MSLTVYLGTHMTQWLGRLSVPLFISHRRLAQRRTFPRALGRYAIDSGGFSEIALHGRWVTTPEEYVAACRRYLAEIGPADFCAIQDFMCEPPMLKKTGLSVLEHQKRTCDSYARLLDMAPEVPRAPVLQGWEMADYRRHVEMYAARGLDLKRAPLVGVGSVCRRQHTGEVEDLLRELAGEGYRLHGFGFKIQGLPAVADALVSSDSLAWSFNARKNPPLPGCTHKSCANCPAWALEWLRRLHRNVASRGAQLNLFGGRGAA